jgi:cobalt/nickel transport system permease protein
VLAVTASLQLGAFCVVLETLASGVTALPFKTFLLLMQPIHLAIGLVEGLVTAAVLCFLHAARPELLTAALEEKQISGGVPLKKVLITFLALAAVLAGVVSLYASQNPDGLEWSIRGVTGSTELKSGDAVHKAAGKAVKRTALMPDYATDSKGGGTAAAGLIGSAVTLAAAAGVGGAVHAARKRKKQ